MVRPLENTFSWSLSRHRTFQECPRRYWFHYYGAWGGWDPAAPPEARELYLLKNITNLHLIAGDTVHRAIERALQAWARGNAPDPEALVLWCKAEMQRSFVESREQTWREGPKRYARLFEHHYGPKPHRTLLERIAAKVGTSVRGFFRSPSFGIIREIRPESWLPMETLDTFDFEGTLVYAVPDFACRREADLLLFDWKTGLKDDRNQDQVALYTLFAAAKWDIDPDRVLAAPVYLMRGGAFEPRRVPEEERERVRAIVRDSIGAMRQRLADPGRNEARKEAFEPVPGYACRSCNFRAVCPEAR